ncbi:MAG: ABC transporter permease [Gallionellaceae bacterium]|nr:MAG: ABC transporter permease [Gallionellaceae bacterium]
MECNERKKGASVLKYFINSVLHHGKGAVFPIVVIALWEAASRQNYIPENLLPPPSDLLHAFVDLLASGNLKTHIVASMLRVVAGFSIGAFLAIVVGAALGFSRTLESYFDPTFQALRAIPSLAWVPLLLLWQGIGEAPKVTLIAIGAFFPVYMSLVAGIHNVDKKLVELGQVYGLSKFDQIHRIFIPASLPYMFTGLRTGLSLSWMFLVASELIAASEGLGYLLTDGRETARVDIVIITIILLALLGKLSDSLLKTIEHRVLSWRDTYVKEI